MLGFKPDTSHLEPCRDPSAKCLVTCFSSLWAMQSCGQENGEEGTQETVLLLACKTPGMTRESYRPDMPREVLCTYSLQQGIFKVSRYPLVKPGPGLDVGTRGFLPTVGLLPCMLQFIGALLQNAVTKPRLSKYQV